MSTGDVLNQVLALPENERAEIAHELLLSLEELPFDDDVDAVWAAEIQRRRESIRNGTVQLADWDDALARMRKALRPE